MENRRFPEALGGDMGGKTFQQIFSMDPKTTEFVSDLWFPEETTGLFLELLKFIKLQLKNPTLKKNHIKRCREYVKTLNKKKIPSYLKKYI